MPVYKRYRESEAQGWSNLTNGEPVRVWVSNDRENGMSIWENLGSNRVLHGVQVELGSRGHYHVVDALDRANNRYPNRCVAIMRGFEYRILHVLREES